MSRNEIPARTVILCDRCRIECEGGNNFKHTGRLVLTRAALDRGVPVADASIRMDLCDPCVDVVAAAIEQA